MEARDCLRLADYVKILEEDADEWPKLVRALAIQYSGFFRNPGTFRRLYELCLPELWGAGPEKTTSVLSAGCSHGEELYSLAIMFDWAGQKHKSLSRFCFRGIDFDNGALQAARQGIYRESAVADIPADIRERYFVRDGDKYGVIPAIKEQAEFSAQDLFGEFLFPDTSLIMCRNVLIYYRREQQRTITENLLKSLSPGGWLVLGKTESLPAEYRKYFAALDSDERIYRKLGE